MESKKFQDSENQGCCAKCLGCLMCCNLPASAGVKLISIFSILFGLVYCCLGVWTLIVTTSNKALPPRQQLVYEVWTSEVNDVEQDVIVASTRKFVPLQTYYGLLIALACTSLGVGFVRTLSSTFLLWNSVEKKSTGPGKFWIFLAFLGTTTIVSFLIYSLNVTGFIKDCPLLSPMRVHNDKFSFYILITIFRCFCLADIMLTIYFIFIVVWFVRTR